MGKHKAFVVSDNDYNDGFVKQLVGRYVMVHVKVSLCGAINATYRNLGFILQATGSHYFFSKEVKNKMIFWKNKFN